MNCLIQTSLPTNSTTKSTKLLHLTTSHPLYNSTMVHLSFTNNQQTETTESTNPQIQQLVFTSQLQQDYNSIRDRLHKKYIDEANELISQSLTPVKIYNRLQDIMKTALELDYYCSAFTIRIDIPFNLTRISEQVLYKYLDNVYTNDNFSFILEMNTIFIYYHPN
jgi:hypothetical protein